jgi:DNA-binding transcriptional LysR family regulator
MNLRSLDLNLLVVFDAVFNELNITKAGRKIGLSQSSVSNSLARLRGHLNDELFLRGPGSLRPTPRALELAAPIRSTLLNLEGLLDPKKFDPSTESRVFTIVASDYFAVTLAPQIARYLSVHAPNISVRIRSDVAHAAELLDRGEAEFAAGLFPDLDERFGNSFLAEDTYAGVIRSGHPLANTTPTLEQYAAMKHVLVSLKGDGHSFVDEELAKRGLTRHVAMTVGSFAAALGIVEAGDFVLTVPSRIVKQYPCKGSFVFPSPVDAPVSLRRLDLIWHTRLSNHPAHRWFAGAIKHVATSM